MADAIIIGGGPAGASCALWLKRLGHEPLLVEARRELGGLLVDSPFRNDWIVAAPPAEGTDIARTIQANIADAGVACRLGETAVTVRREGEEFTITLSGGDTPRARHVVLATGVRPARGGLPDKPGIVFGPGPAIAGADFAGKAVAVLGGGDNAFENWHFITARGGDATIFTRHVRARRQFRDGVPAARIVHGDCAVDAARRSVNGRPFDMIAVFYGFEPVLPALEPSPEREGTALRTDAHCETGVPGLFAIGEMAARMHPSVVTAMADGVVAAKRIAARLEAPQRP